MYHSYLVDYSQPERRLDRAGLLRRLAAAPGIAARRR